MVNEILSKLNESQIKPVLATEGAVLVIAGAGSGKTRVLTNRIAYLIKEKGVKPHEILAITFTNKAADEMKVRLENLVGSLDGMWASTIHSMCVKILRSNIGHIGYEKNFSIYNEEDKEKAIKRIIAEMELEPDKYLKLAKSEISWAKNEDLSPREYKESKPHMSNVGLITEIYAKYNEVLKKSNALDFDDLLVKTLHLLTESDEVASYYQRKFKYVHIDEFQDTNVVQYKIAKILTAYYGNIFVVGDDDQSIYGWRGAKISNILNFEYDFAGAKVFKLEQNYRSTKNILNVANLIIKNNEVRKDKTLWTDNETGDKVELFTALEETDEATHVATQIKRLINKGKRASDFAILMRINALSRAYEQELLKYNIPYKVYGGFKFFDRKEIKDLTAYLRVISNPLDNEAVLRIINVPRRGIGDKTVDTLILKAQEEGLSVFDVIMDADSLALSSGALSRIKEFKKLLYDLIIESGEKTISETIKNVINKTAFLSQFDTDTEENLDKKMNVNELINSASEFEKVNPTLTLSDYLSSITLSSDTDEMDEGNFVTIATIHSVKGLEFENVFVVGLDETIFPISRAVNSPEELEEERRLLYVAITRAKKTLKLTRARSRYLYGSRSITAESRFLKEIQPLLNCEEEAPKYSSYQNRSNGGYGSFNRYQKEDDYGYYPDEPSNSGYSGRTKSFSSGYNLNKPKTLGGNSSAKYTTGMKVSHKKFGVGTVIAVKNDGKFIDVAFANLGIKSLAAEIAPLEIVK